MLSGEKGKVCLLLLLCEGTNASAGARTSHLVRQQHIE
jgi:hypothetical protein